MRFLNYSFLMDNSKFFSILPEDQNQLTLDGYKAKIYSQSTNIEKLRDMSSLRTIDLDTGKERPPMKG